MAKKEYAFLTFLITTLVVLTIIDPEASKNVFKRSFGPVWAAYDIFFPEEVLRPFDGIVARVDADTGRIHVLEDGGRFLMETRKQYLDWAQPEMRVSGVCSHPKHPRRHRALGKRDPIVASECWWVIFMAEVKK